MLGRTVFHWVRDVLAVFGLLSCLAVFLLFVAFFLPYSRPTPTVAAQGGKPTLEEANWLLYSAGLDRNSATVELLDSGAQPPGDEDGAWVQAWCLRATRMPVLGATWRAPQDLDPVLAHALAGALRSGRTRASCVPDVAAATQGFTKVRMMRAEVTDGRANSASVALYDADHAALYLVHAALLPPAASSPAPSTE
jgi:hypothetical protein